MASTAASGPRLLRPLICTAVGMVGNVLLTAGKLAVGYLSGSASLVADGFHSFSDLAGDVGVLIALRASAMPPDNNHPYGHHNFETLGAMGVSTLLLITGVLLGHDAVMSFLHGTHSKPGGPALAAAAISIVSKEAMARYTYAAAARHNSPALRANAAHHRSDVLSSVAAAAGIGGAMMGVVWLDSAAELLIAGMIMWMGMSLLRDNAMILMETKPTDAYLERIHAAAYGIRGIRSVSSLRVRPRGSVYMVDIEVTVDPDLTVREGHDLAHAVEDAMIAQVEGVIGAVVHVEPHPPGRAAPSAGAGGA
ncbi:MAG TPA: cation diffusion facilitator family transporter [Candidatus Krumholzibacteria bacterium]|nr:cation diffusion facilitator family transporter [Candidatus Krumholzibacteria bacterium]HRX51702.1 cation diffusion facilitator family transporter [Candidatus Krumholzibacteria bacterium]